MLQAWVRGHNGDEGLMTRFARMEGQIANLDVKIETVKQSVGNLTDVPAKIELWARYPSLTWLVHHRFKEMALITAAAILLTVFIGIPGNYINERIQLVIEALFTRLLGL